MLETYRHQVFDQLNEFETACENLEKHYGKLVRLVEIIERHNLQSLVGIGLLHKHFDLHEDEYLVKTYQTPTIAEIRPEYCTGESLIPYLWKMGRNDRAETGFKFYPLEFIKVGQHTEAYPIVKTKKSDN